VVGLSLFLALAVGAVVWLTTRGTTYHAPLVGPPPPGVDENHATTLLGELQTAVRRHDAAAAARLGDTPQARTDLAGVVRNARALHVEDFSLRYVDVAGAVASDGAWSAEVATTWQFVGFDERLERLEVRVRFVPVGGRLRIAEIGGGGSRSPLWLSGPLQVRRGPQSMVLVDGDASQADALAALARRAVSQVRAVLPEWPGGLVVEVPASEHALDAVLGASPGQYDGIAAVTTSVDGSRARRAPSHVYVNPQVFLPLKPRGAQVVITHEATHVATDAASSPAPIWLVEGFADFVALSSQHLPTSTTAARVIALVRRSGAPTHLPGRAEFAAGAPHLEARYESAWLACRLLARDGGTAALVAFYRAVDAGGRLAPELRSTFGFGPAAFTRQWRTLLSHLPA
jgi:hypothetical protein